MKLIKRFSPFTLSLIFILQCIPSQFIFASELSNEGDISNELDSKYKLSTDNEKILNINGTELYCFSNGDYNFALQRSAQGYVDFAIYYIDENVQESFSPEVVYSKVIDGVNEENGNNLIGRASPPYLSYKATAEAYCGSTFLNKEIAAKSFKDKDNVSKVCKLQNNHTMYYTHSKWYSATANVAISGLMAWCGWPEALIFQIITVAQNTQGIFVFVKSFTSEIYIYEDNFTKIAYIDGRNWYSAGSTKKYASMSGDKGWDLILTLLIQK